MNEDQWRVITRIDNSIATYKQIIDLLYALSESEPMISPEQEFVRKMVTEFGGRVTQLGFDRRRWERIDED